VTSTASLPRPSFGGISGDTAVPDRPRIRHTVVTDPELLSLRVDESLPASTPTWRVERSREPEKHCMKYPHKSRLSSIVGTLLMVQAFTVVAVAQASDGRNEFWPEFDLFINLNQQSRIFVMYTATKSADLPAYADGQAGVYFDYWMTRPLRKAHVAYFDPSRSKLLMVRFGYLLNRPKNNSGNAMQHTATFEVTSQAQLPAGLLLSERNRVDLGWTQGDPNHRYRNRLKLGRTFDAGSFQFTPYAHAEVFYGFNEGKWTRFRYAAGAEWSITKRIALEGYYLRENTWDAVPQFVNGFGLVLQFHLR
jgi:hypothetical protein